MILVWGLMVTMTGCFYWWRAYQTYRQMNDFDEHFSISVKHDFTVHFKDPVLFSEDFVSLAKLRPSIEKDTSYGKLWTYVFRKIDRQGQYVTPEIKFYFTLAFNQEDKVIAWSFSPMFLQIAPPAFLELSFRSLGKAEINQDKKQLKVNADKINKINVALPLKSAVLEQLGDPLEIENGDSQEMYLYHFKLETPDIEAGYEDRALSVLKLTFDKITQEMVKMSGRFAGLKIAINYRKYQQKPTGV